MENIIFTYNVISPAVAYNEVARLVYERARTAYVSSDPENKYTNGTDPITQSLGDGLQAEMQWVARRLTYISSYAAFGDFGRRDGEGSAGSLNFRSIIKKQIVHVHNLNFLLYHIFWMYPLICHRFDTILWGW